MPADPPRPQRVLLIVGSARDGRLAPQIASWLLEQAGRRTDLVFETVDVSETALPDSLDENHERVRTLRPVLAAADAFVLIAPEYNRGIPGPLKTLIDCFNEEWEAKPVGFVGYGLSIAGGVRAIEHLRQIFAEFHCVGMKDVVAFPRVLEHFDAQGSFAPAPASAAAADLMLDQLTWWCRALSEAKERRPYGT